MPCRDIRQHPLPSKTALAIKDCWDFRVHPLPSRTAVKDFRAVRVPSWTALAIKDCRHLHRHRRLLGHQGLHESRGACPCPCPREGVLVLAVALCALALALALALGAAALAHGAIRLSISACVTLMLTRMPTKLPTSPILTLGTGCWASMDIFSSQWNMCRWQVGPTATVHLAEELGQTATAKMT